MEISQYQSTLFKNRLKKRFKHLSKIAKRENIFAYRLYDKDIPEIPLALDIYFTESLNNTEKAFLIMFLYKRPYERSENKETLWLAEMKKAACEALSICSDNIFIKIRKKMHGNNQYTRVRTNKNIIKIREGKCLFYINLEDYLDSWLFLDHRPARLKIYKSAKDKTVLNLFSYTGSFSVHAMSGGALSVDSVDLSKTYLDIAKKNLELNGLYSKLNTRLIKSDVILFLEKAFAANNKWDIIICDPPTFSNSKSAAVFDVNRDWLKLCLLCLSVLKPSGVFYFSTNSKKIKFNTEKLITAFKEYTNKNNIIIEDLSEKSIPEDFRNKKIHKLWCIKLL